MASVLPNDHVTDDVTDPEWLTSGPSYLYMQISQKRFEIEVLHQFPTVAYGGSIDDVMT